MKPHYFILVFSVLFKINLYAQNKDSLIIEGDKLFNSKDYVGSMNLYSEALRLDSNNAALFLRKGKALLKNNDLKSALKNLSVAIQLDSNNAEAYRTRAIIHKNYGNSNSFRLDIEKAKDIEDKERKNERLKILDNIKLLGIKIEKNSFNTEFIFDAPNKSKSELFSNAYEWLANSYNDANTVIQMNDKESGTLMGKGIYSFNIGKGFSGAIIKVPHTITIKVKDNKVKLNINTLSIKGTGVDADERTAEETFKAKKHRYLFKKIYFDELEDELTFTLASMCMSIKLSILKTQNDW